MLAVLQTQSWVGNDSASAFGNAVRRYENEKFRVDEQQSSEAAGNKREEEMREAARSASPETSLATS